MKKILFFARLPLSEKDKMDGEIQRVLILDKMASIENFDRTYIHIKFKSLVNKIYQPEFLDNVNVYSLSIFRIKTWFLIINLIKSSDISYFHSLHNYKFAFVFNYWLKNTFKVIDFHGVVPEENFFLGNTLRGHMYNLIEQTFFNFFDAYVCVSKSMIIFYQDKYQVHKNSFHLLPMVRSNEDEIKTNLNNFYRNKFNIPSNMPVVIYTGNCQKWQNIDMMMDSIKEVKSNIFFIILSAEVDKFLKIIEHKKITKNIMLKSVEPKHLFQYYSVANYGYLLRDDNSVNNVANPTKLVEYLQFGIIPIILSRNTSDIDIMDVNSIYLKDLGKNKLSFAKSTHNINIYEKFYNSHNYKLSEIIKDYDEH